jgi:hypothetical protein
MYKRIVWTWVRLSSACVAQIGSWKAVQHLTPGTPISVQSRLRILRRFRSADERQLVCDRMPAGGIVLHDPAIRFDRREILQVRLEHSPETNALIAAGVFGSVGAGLAAARSGQSGITPGGAALFGGGIGAIFGFHFGRLWPIHHREVIYQP